MTSKLVPADPDKVMVIREVAPRITTFSVPFLRFGTLKWGGRATIIKLSTGALFVFSPIALTPNVRDRISSLGGRVSYIAAPDLEHHLFLSTWAAAYPSAHLIAPGGLAEKRAAAAEPGPAFHTTITAENKHTVKISPEVDAEMDYELVDAHVNKEVVFFHRPSKTLIQADLLFNLPATEQYSRSGEGAEEGLATRLSCSQQNTVGNAQRRMLWYLLSARDRKGFNASMKRINAWGFENIIPCHGDTIVGDGKAVFERVMQWHLQAKE